jgi:hypothetical protein
MLGDLPSLGISGGKKMPSPADKKHSLSSDLDTALSYTEQRSTMLGSPQEQGKTPSRKADTKKKKKGKKPKEEDYSHMPEEYLCQLTRKPMSDPVKTTYGNVYDRAAILKWLSTQGKICPLTGDSSQSSRCAFRFISFSSPRTGAPLSEAELSPVEGLGDEIRAWILRESTGQNVDRADEEGGAEVATGLTPTKTAHMSPIKEKETKNAAGDDDLYDF